MKRFVLLAALAVLGCQTGRNCDCDYTPGCEIGDGQCTLNAVPALAPESGWEPAHPEEPAPVDAVTPVPSEVPTPPPAE